MTLPSTTRPQFLSEVPAQKNVTSAGFNRPRASVPPPPPRPLPDPVAGAEAPPPPSPSAPLPAPSAPAIPFEDTRLQAAIAHLREYAGRLAEQARSDAMEIGFQVARKILEAEVTTSPAPLFGLVRSAVQRLGESRKVVIHLSPGDLSRLDAEGGAKALGLAVAQIELLPDSTLTAGDCVVESDLGRVDGRLSTRLAELHRALTAEEAA